MKNFLLNLLPCLLIISYSAKSSYIDDNKESLHGQSSQTRNSPTTISSLNVLKSNEDRNLTEENSPQVKGSVIILSITNNTGYSITNPSPWFGSGRVADGWSFPTTILTGSTGKVEMYEKDWSLAGCAGYVNYTLNNGIFTIAYSNPDVGSNKIGCGVGGSDIYDNMNSHYSPTNVNFSVNGVSLTATISSTDGSVNNANVNLYGN